MTLFHPIDYTGIFKKNITVRVRFSQNGFPLPRHGGFRTLEGGAGNIFLPREFVSFRRFICVSCAPLDRFSIFYLPKRKSIVRVVHVFFSIPTVRVSFYRIFLTIFAIGGGDFICKKKATFLHIPFRNNTFDCIVINFYSKTIYPSLNTFPNFITF